ncbi:protoporphyrinogen oxidase [Melioribacteraceae bacterium 4301-Me]|uniref:protoporphyrinogen oxidase n=1 Tax=Pyranulibacter aquaticus TaxID=3163344 RepID=UPI0035994624
MGKKVVILGAGISGLATAFWLHKDGFDVTVLEAKKVAGGSMESSIENSFLIDFGPNSGLETTPLIKKLVDEVGLFNEFIYANEKANKRYILKNNQLHPLPMGPGAFISTKLFSTKAKFRLLTEPFIGKSNDGYYQSVSEFVIRRLGREFLDYAIDPFVSGVFAGDPNKLSVKSAFPKLYRLEELYGGLIKGMIKGAKERKHQQEQSKQSAKMFSFLKGMQSLPLAISKKLGNNIFYECNVQSVERTTNGFKVVYKSNGETKELSSDYVISTVPAYAASEIFKNIDENVSNHLNEIYYPPVMVLYLGFKKEFINQQLDGFGYLIPSKEKKSYLGAIWSSVIFQNRANDDSAAFTLFIGGARSPQLFEMSESKLIENVIKEFSATMKISSEPIFVRYKLWKKAIPQYNIGYIEHENYFDKFEKENPGILLSGNYRGGISVGDCIKNSELIFNKIKYSASQRLSG